MTETPEILFKKLPVSFSGITKDGFRPWPCQWAASAADAMNRVLVFIVFSDSIANLMKIYLFLPKTIQTIFYEKN